MFLAGSTVTDTSRHSKGRECIGIRHASTWAYSLGFSHVILETDHQGAASFSKGAQNSMEWSSIAMLEDIRVLGMLFKYFEVVYVKRTCNMAAHMLASRALLLRCHIWE